MIAIRPLAEADVAAAQRLREQAGWNQTDHDWRRLLTWSPDGCWAAELDGQVVGTTTVTTYGRRIAWIGMVLVDEAHRRQGIGRALLGHALEHLDRLGIETIALDSTPEGRPLYARLGFADAFELARWRGPIPPAPHDPDPVPRSRERVVPSDAAPAGSAAAPAHPSLEDQARRRPSGRSEHGSDERSGRDGRAPTTNESRLRPLTPADLATVAAYDARLFGTNRAHILGALAGGHPGHCFVAERHGQLTGYVLSRPGARAWHLGPLAADDPPTAERLARQALPPVTASSPQGVSASAPRPADLVIDVVMPNAAAVDLAMALGLAQVRRFIRMTRGAPPPPIDVGRLYTSAGPELG